MPFAHDAAEWRFALPYPQVFDAAVRAAAMAGFTVKGVDPMAGTVAASTGPSWTSWGEHLQVRVGAVSPTLTAVQLGSSLKLGTEVFAAGKHRRNVQRFFDAMRQQLGPGLPPRGP